MDFLLKDREQRHDRCRIYGVRYMYRIIGKLNHIYDLFISEKDKKMGIRDRIKRKAKLALKYAVDWVIDEDLSSVGVPPQQAEPKKESAQEDSVQESPQQSSETVVQEEVPVETPTEEVPAEPEAVDTSTQDGLDASQDVAEDEPVVETKEMVEVQEQKEEKEESASDDGDESPSEPEEVEESEEDSSQSSSDDDDSNKDSDEGSIEEESSSDSSSDEDSSEEASSNDEPQEIVAEEKIEESSNPNADEEVEDEEIKEEPVLSPEEKKAQAAAKHLAKTKRGLVQKVSDLGGATTLPELHDYSEKKFFVGHKRFSDLMEEMIAEELILFSYEDSAITLGAKAKEFLS